MVSILKFFYDIHYLPVVAKTHGYIQRLDKIFTLSFRKEERHYSKWDSIDLPGSPVKLGISVVVGYGFLMNKKRFRVSGVVSLKIKAKKITS